MLSLCRRICRSCILVLLLCLPISCTPRSETTALSLVLAMTESAADIPAGDIYLLPDSTSLHALSSIEGSQTAIRAADSALLRAVFGINGIGDNAEELWQCTAAIIEDGAMRLSTAASPCEWMAFRCVGRSDTTAVADLLLCRLEILRRQYRGSDDEAMLARAEVVIFGKYVLLVIAPDSKAAVAAAQRALS